MATTSSISSLSTSTIQELILNNVIHSRRLLFHNPLLSSPPPSSDSSQLQPWDGNTFDANVVMILSVLLCAVICSLALHSIIRCALRCSNFVARDSSSNRASPSALIANTGIKKKALKTLPIISYTVDHELSGLDTECVICLSNFAPGEQVKLLPQCHHGFHIQCIDKWLSANSSCPTCRNCLIETCNKIVASTSARSVAVIPAPHPQEVVIIKIEPLLPECMIRNHEINLVDTKSLT